jgi:hypothetical protein
MYLQGISNMAAVSLFMLALIGVVTANDKRCSIYDNGCAFHVILAGSDCSPNHISNSYVPNPKIVYSSRTQEGFANDQATETLNSKEIKEDLQSTNNRLDRLEKSLTELMEGLSVRSLRLFRKIKHELKDMRGSLNTIQQMSSKDAKEDARVSRSIKCPNGFHTIGMWSSCYKFSSTNTTFTEAEEFCKAYGSTLVSVEDVKEAYVLDSLIESKAELKHVDRWWTSGKYIPVNCKWMWTSPTQLRPMRYSRWAPGEPNGRSTSHCMVIYVPNAFEWEDAMCTESHHFICEIETK